MEIGNNERRKMGRGRQYRERKKGVGGTHSIGKDDKEWNII